MGDKKPYCLVRNLDDPSQSSLAVGIDCFRALEEIKKGKYGDNWQLEECVNSTIGSAALLRVIARSNQSGGVEIVHDKEFENFFKSNKEPVPDSVAIKLLF